MNDCFLKPNADKVSQEITVKHGISKAFRIYFVLTGEATTPDSNLKVLTQRGLARNLFFYFLKKILLVSKSF